MTVTVATTTERNHYGVALRIKSKWYKQRPVGSHTFETEWGETQKPPVISAYSAYLRWLARERGWMTLKEACVLCKGNKRIPAYNLDRMMPSRRAKWKRDRRKIGLPAWLTTEDFVACDECGGTGEQDCAPRPDLDRAQRYIAEQRQAQEHRADTAVSIVRWRFLVLGAVLYREHDDLLSFQGRLIYIGHRSRGRSYDRKANPHQAELIINPDLIQTEMELCDLVDDFVSSFDRGLLSLAEGYNADEEQRA